MRICLFIVTSICLFCATAFAEPEIKGTPSDLIKYLKITPDSVTISTEATYEVEAESAVAMISVITENEALKKSLVQNQNLRKEIIKQLTSAGITSEKINGTKFSSTPKYGIFTKKPSSYKVENILKIVVGNEMEFQAVADVIDLHEEVFYRELKFIHNEEEKHRLKALEKALSTIQKKKELYEKRLGVILLPKRFTDQKVPESNLIEQVRYEKSKFSSNATASPIFGGLIYNASINIEYYVNRNEK